MSHFGIDCYGFPGPAKTKTLYGSGIRTICFYLANGGYLARSWTNAAYDILASQGWGFLPTFSGYRPGDPRRHEDPKDRYVSGQLAKLDRALGSSQASQTAKRMADVGFPSGAVIYLDLETGDALSGDYLDYVVTWMTTVRSLGYEAAVYCPSGAIPTVKALLPWRNKPLIWLAKPDPAWPRKQIDLDAALPAYPVSAGVIALQFAVGEEGAGNAFIKGGNTIGNFDCNMSIVPNPSDFSAIDATALADLAVAEFVPASEGEAIPNQESELARARGINQSIVNDPVNVVLGDLRDRGISGDEDSTIGSLDADDFASVVNQVNNAGEAVFANPVPEKIANWIRLRLRLLGAESESFNDVTTEIVAHYPTEVGLALDLVPSALKAQAVANIPELSVQTHSLQAPANIQVAVGSVGHLSFMGKARVGSIITGELTVPDAAGVLHAFKINTGSHPGGYRYFGGPTPPGTYTVIGPFPPDPKGMTRSGVGYKFKLLPYQIHVPGGSIRGLFCIHPDGPPPGTLGCLGIAESEAALIQCRDLIKALIASKISVEVVVDYEPGVLF